MTIAVRPPAEVAKIRATLELRHARIRLALAENNLALVQTCLGAGDFTPAAALEFLDDAMDELDGGRAMTGIEEWRERINNAGYKPSPILPTDDIDGSTTVKYLDAPW